MPVETRSSRRSRPTPSASRSRHTPQAATASHPSTRVQKRKNDGTVSNTIKQLPVELSIAVERTEDLEDAFRDISSRFKDALSNLEVAKGHHHTAMEQARESKRIICRYLELGMTIPPCKSLDLPMEVYSDESNYKLAEMIKEQEVHISRLKRSVDELREQVLESRKDVRRVKRKIYKQQIKSRKRVV